jgi:hypothetical protein
MPTPMTDGPVHQATTAALRERSIDRLVDGFRQHIERASTSATGDPRDEMLSLTPFFDCCRRLGHDPAVEFGPIATTGAPWVRETFEMFVRRTPVTLGAMGWSIVETPDGPAYRFAWPRWTPPKRDRRPEASED